MCSINLALLALDRVGCIPVAAQVGCNSSAPKEAMNNVYAMVAMWMISFQHRCCCLQVARRSQQDKQIVGATLNWWQLPPIKKKKYKGTKWYKVQGTKWLLPFHTAVAN